VLATLGEEQARLAKRVPLLLKLAPDLGEDPGVEGERGRGLPMAQKLGMAELARAWQMLLKGLGEAQNAPSPLQAAEMVLVRIAYAADLPPPDEVIRNLTDTAARAAPARSGGATAASSAPVSYAEPARNEPVRSEPGMIRILGLGIAAERKFRSCDRPKPAPAASSSKCARRVRR